MELLDKVHISKYTAAVNSDRSIVGRDFNSKLDMLEFGHFIRVGSIVSAYRKCTVKPFKEREQKTRPQ